MKIIAGITMLFLTLVRGNCQHMDGPGGFLNQASQASATEEAARERQARIAAEQAAEQGALNAELQKIYAKDPWRRIGVTTNVARGSGWYEFQGEVSEVLPTGVVFKGKYGAVLTINPEEENEIHLVSSSETQQRVGGVGTTQDTRLHRKILYGDDLFYIDGFPYPTTLGQPFQEMMAMEGGYQTYTNLNRQIVTIHRLDYGTPCTKLYSSEELAAKRDAVNAPKRAMALKVFKDYETKADHGDAYALFRMGQYYRDGEAGIVTKDTQKARDYFSRADAAGYAAAADELKHLPLE